MRFVSFLEIAASIASVFRNAISANAALHSPFLPRSTKANGAVILSSAVKNFKDAVYGVNAAVLNVTSADIDQLLVVWTFSSKLNETIHNQTVIAKKSPKTDEACTDYVQYFVARLVKSVQNLSKDIIAIKDLTVEAGVITVAQVILQTKKQAADMIAGVLITKVPASRAKLTKEDKLKLDIALKKVA